MFLHKQSGGQSHAEIAAIKGKLHQGAVSHAHSENLGKSLHHRVGDVVGEAPQGETTGHQDKGQQVFLFYYFIHFLLILSEMASG